MSKKIDKFTVIRDKWFRGNGGQGSGLLTIGDSVCCLGFFSAACGATDLLGVSMPYNLEPHEQAKLPLWSRGGAVDDIANVNDSAEITDGRREARLKELFAKNGVEVEFV